MTKLFTLLIAILFYSGVHSQEYISAAIGSNKNVHFSLVVNGSKNVYGFGASFFYNKGNKGIDYTNFIFGTLGVYETISAKSGTLYVLYGKKFNNVLVNARLGFGTKKWFNNGRGKAYTKTEDEFWYTYTDGGTYLVYGVDIRKQTKRFILGAGYDNFNGANLSLGWSLKKSR
jgi:hypothetical protein